MEALEALVVSNLQALLSQCYLANKKDSVRSNDRMIINYDEGRGPILFNVIRIQL
jgi:hypothetical protein